MCSLLCLDYISIKLLKLDLKKLWVLCWPILYYYCYYCCCYMIFMMKWWEKGKFIQIHSSLHRVKSSTWREKRICFNIIGFWSVLSQNLQCETIFFFFLLFHKSIWSPSTICAHLNLHYSPSPLPLVTCSPYPVPILQSWLSLLTFKTMFKGFFNVSHAVSIFYFGPFNHFYYSLLPLYLLSPIINSFQYISLYPLPSQMLCLMILLMLYLSLFLSTFPWVP
jgi:hypothetical protein